MKTVSDDLFRLIKSLNKSEKGNFKKFASRNAGGSKQNYILLFDAIDSLDEYDEDLIRNKFKKESFIRQLPVYKVYLFNMILRSMASVSSADDAGSKIRELIDNSKILSSKALYKEALKLLRKAKEIAVKYSNYTLLLDTLIAERNITVVVPDKNVSEQRDNIYFEQITVIDKLKKLLEYSWLSDQMVICVEQKGDFTIAERAKAMEKIYNKPLIANEKNAEDLNMMFYLLHTKLFYHLGKNELNEVRAILKKELTLLEINRHFIDDNPRNYSGALINYLLFSQITGKRDAVLETITKLNRLRKNLKRKVPLAMQVQITFHASNAEILVYRSTCDIRRGKNLVRKMDELLPRYESEVPPQLKVSLISNLASFLVLAGDYKSALKMNNKLMDISGLSFKSDVYLFSRLLNLIIHFELGNYDLLEYMTENTYKFFRDKKIIHRADNLILTLIKDLLKEQKNAFPALFDEFRYNFKKLSADNNTQHLTAMFDFDSWAVSHIENIPMREAAKKNKLK